jgi:protoporphyrinogen oxidase
LPLAKQKIIILGAGVSGLSLAIKLAEYGFDVHCIEMNKQTGGLAKTFRRGRYNFDVGPHSFFTEDQVILAYAKDLLGERLKAQPRKAKFHYNNRFLDYPFTIQTILFNMGLSANLQVGFSFLRQKLTPKVPLEGNETVKDWAINTFGHYLYQTFFKPYTEQFWGIACDQLASRSIPSHTRMNFIHTCMLMFKKTCFWRSQSSLMAREKLPTYYPDTGFGEICEHLTRQAQDLGVKFSLHSIVTDVKRAKDNTFFVDFLQGDKKHSLSAKVVVSTIPLTSFVHKLSPLVPEKIIAATKQLEFRSLLLLAIVTEKQAILGSHYIYFLNRSYNRLSEMNEFSALTSPNKDNILLIEIPCYSQSPLWDLTAEELLEHCLDDLTHDGFLERSDVKKLFVERVPNAYPMYKKDYAESLYNVQEFINQQQNIYTLGRSGEYMYMDADRCMQRAFKLADEINKK